MTPLDDDAAGRREQHLLDHDDGHGGPTDWATLARGATGRRPF